MTADISSEAGVLPLGLILRLLDGWVETAACVLVTLLVSPLTAVMIGLFVLIGTFTRAQWQERGRLDG